MRQSEQRIESSHDGCCSVDLYIYFQGGIGLDLSMHVRVKLGLDEVHLGLVGSKRRRGTSLYILRIHRVASVRDASGGLLRCL